jgi:hypothetical protein
MKRHSHVSSGPPAIPEGRISRFRFWPWLFPRGLSKIGEAQALARIHPTHFGLPLDSSCQSWLLRLTPLAIRGPPSAQSSFACHKYDSWQGGVPAPPRRALPLLPSSYELMRQTSFLFRTSCIHTYFQRSWQVAASPCWKLVLPDVISASLCQDA